MARLILMERSRLTMAPWRSPSALRNKTKIVTPDRAVGMIRP